MGVGLSVIGLYNQMAKEGLFEKIINVAELGSQNLYAAEGLHAVTNLCMQICGKVPSDALSKAVLEQGAARLLYEELGFKYMCVDTDGAHGALVLDLNFDEVPKEHKLAYDFTTNFGTTEHLINQGNAFKFMHDLTKPGGLMLHSLPFMGYLDHGFFCYQPNFFESLAEYNGYEILGVYTDIDWGAKMLIPYDKTLLKYLRYPEHMQLCVLLKKRYDQPFCIPFQGMYTNTRAQEAETKYNFVVDGQILNAKYMSSQMSANNIKHYSSATLYRELRSRVSKKFKKSIFRKK